MWIILHKPKGEKEWAILSHLMFKKDQAETLLSVKRKRYSLLAEFKLAKIEVLDD